MRKGRELEERVQGEVERAWRERYVLVVVPVLEAVPTFVTQNLRVGTLEEGEKLLCNTCAHRMRIRRR